MWRVDPGPLTPFCIITLRLPNWGVSTSALSVAAAEPTDRLERRNQKQPTHSHPAPKGKKNSLKSPHVEIKFSEDWKQMCSDGQFFHCPCSQWLVLILPSVGENTKFSAWWRWVRRSSACSRCLRCLWVPVDEDGWMTRSHIGENKSVVR